jgi:hypothetical protein
LIRNLLFFVTDLQDANKTFLLVTFSDPDPQHWLKKGYYPKDDFINHGVQYILSGQLQQSGILL